MRQAIYTKEFTEEACRLVFEQSISILQAAKNLGISDGILGRWSREIKSHEKTTKKVLILSDHERIRDLEAEVKRLRLGAEKEIAGIMLPWIKQSTFIMNYMKILKRLKLRYFNGLISFTIGKESIHLWDIYFQLALKQKFG